MSIEHIRSGSRDRIVSLYQVDPGFYRKIISRSTSLGGSTRKSVYRSAANGKVPFTWEMEPGEPINSTNTEIVPPISLPPAVHGLAMPRPTSLPPMENDNNAKRSGKKMPIKLPAAFRRLAMPKPKVSPAEAKAYLMKNVKKVKEIRYSDHLLGKRKEKPLEVNSSGGNVGPRDFALSSFETENGPTSSSSSSRGNSKSSESLSLSVSSISLSSSFPSSSITSSSAVSSSGSDKSARLVRLWRLPKMMMKWKISKSTGETS